MAKQKKPEQAEQTKTAVSHNPTLIEWPTDVWGLTKDFKKAFIAMASRIKGAPDKMQLVQDTLDVALGHLEAKYKQDNARLKARVAAAETAEANGEIEPTVLF